MFEMTEATGVNRISGIPIVIKFIFQLKKTKANLHPL